MSAPFWETNLIYRVVTGSQAYGLATETSDTDTRGVCIPPAHILLGLTPFEQWENPTHDHAIYALSKFVRLALACNPGVVEMLYTPPECVLLMNEYGRDLVAHRALFLTRQAGRTFSEYALAQLHRLEGHHRWLVSPPAHPPAPEEFGGWAVAGRYKFPDHEAQRAYQNALKQWNQYQTWRRERNPERAALEARYGYDTKHAMHLLRLLQMGLEILETGVVQVRRPDREWLLAVRNGALTYEALLAQATAMAARLATLYETSSLPETPDFAAAEALVVALHARFLREQGALES